MTILAGFTQAGFVHWNATVSLPHPAITIIPIITIISPLWPLLSHIVQQQTSFEYNEMASVTEHPPTLEQIEADQDEYDRLFTAEVDSFDVPTTTRRELWSYYLYYNGRHGRC
jgi:hypothetical protein